MSSISVDMNKDKFHKRAGTTDQGKDYENLLVAYYALKLTLTEDVKEFKISSNDDKYGNFDDLVIQITWQNGQMEQYNIQAKHKQVNKNNHLTLEALTADKGKFSIKKRFEEFSENQEKNQVNLILFTNRVMEISEDKKLIQDFAYTIYITRHRVKNEILNTSKQINIYKFYIKVDINADISSTKMEEIKKYRSFFSNFYLYTNQKNVHDIRDATSKILVDTFECDKNVVKNFLDFISTWSNGDGSKHKLTKEFLKLKITECLLSLYALAPSEDKETEQTRLFKQAINDFDVTVVSDSNVSENFYRIVCGNINLDLLNEIGLKYQLIPRYVKRFEDVFSQNRAFLLWLLDECPLIIKVTPSNEQLVYRTINMYQTNEKKKKIVIIGTQRLSLGNYKTFRTLSDLYNESYDLYNNFVAKFTCSFQGQREISLENLIQNDEEIRNVITTNEMIAMIDNTCNFGGQKEYLPDYYIQRRLTKITIDFEFVDKFGDVNVIVINCNGKFNILKNHLPGTNFLVVDDSSDLINTPTESSIEFFNKNNIYVAYKKCPSEVYEKICEKHSNNPCHLFQVDQNCNLEWLESSNNIENLKSFRTQTSHYIKEKNAFDTYQLNLICANPGMGKSIMMSNFKNNYSSQVWVIKVFLREHINFFKNSVDYQQFLYYIFNKTSLTEFERRIVDIFTDKKRLVLMWDGIDEIGKNAFESVLGVIENLQSMGFVQWITARSNLKQVLEDRLNIFARGIKPFGKKDQEIYIKKRLQQEVKDFEKVSEEIMLHVDNDHLEVPLQIFMLTELYLQNDKLCRSLLTNALTIADLFEYFIEEKFNFYYKKADIDMCNNIAKQILHEHKNQRLENYEILGLRLCIESNLLEVLNLNNTEDFLKKIKEENDCFGILEVVNDHPNFCHRTYAEYFVAVWLSKNYAKIKHLKTVFFEERFRSIRFMFDLIMAKQCPVHVSVLYRNLEYIDANIDKVDLQDTAGRSPLHIASSWGEPHPLLNTRYNGKKFIIEAEKGFLVKDNDANYKQIIDTLVPRCDISQKDKLFHFDYLQYADRSLSLAALDAIAKYHIIDYRELENFRDLPTVLFYIAKFDYLNLLKIIDDIPYIKTNQSNSLLHLAAGFNRPILVRKLLQNKKYKDKVNKRDKKTWAPIHYAACFGHVQMINTLKDMGGDIHLGSKNGEETPLYVAAMLGQIEVIKYLIDNKANVNVSKKNGWTPLLVATQKQNLSVIKLLIDNKANVNAINQDGYSSLYVAARKGDLEILKYLISKNAIVNLCGKNGESPLYIAAKLGHLKVIKCLIQKGANVNATKNIGWTPLLTAVRHGHFHIVKLLLENNAVYNAAKGSFFKKIKSNELSTCPLEIASERGYLDIANLLFQKGAKMDIDSGQNYLYKAIGAGYLDMVKLLIANGAEVKPDSVLIAVKKGYVSLANYLLEKMPDNMEKRNLKLKLTSKYLPRTKSQPLMMSTIKPRSDTFQKRKKWMIIIFLMILMTSVVLGGSSILNYLIDVKLN